MGGGSFQTPSEDTGRSVTRSSGCDSDNDCGIRFGEGVDPEWSEPDESEGDASDDMDTESSLPSSGDFPAEPRCIFDPETMIEESEDLLGLFTS